MIFRISRHLLQSTKPLSRQLDFRHSSSYSIMGKDDNSKGDMSVRATKRSRARAHYRKKHKVVEKDNTEEDTSLTDYYFENGLRKVYPYYYNFSTYVKQRWFGRAILEVFTKEFPGETEEKYREELEEGRLTVNGKKVSTTHKLTNGEFLEHKTHRHENPTLDTRIEVIADTPDVLVINKPASIPCHPCGRYRFNSITFILEKEMGYKNLRTLYRLDRMTSGVLIMPKTKATSSKMEKQLYNRQLQKEYVCRVVGKFPDGPVQCNQPLGVLSNTLYMNRVDPKGKESSTTFTRLSYNGSTSIVKCVPHTGRTHQIRVHLQYLGYPIVNDNLYNTPAFGPHRGKGGVIDLPVEKVVEEVRKYHNTGVWKLGPNPLYEKKMKEKQMSKLSSDSPSRGNESTMCDELSAAKTGDILTGDRQECDVSENTSCKIADVTTDDQSKQTTIVDNCSLENGESAAKRAKFDADLKDLTGRCSQVSTNSSGNNDSQISQLQDGGQASNTEDQSVVSKDQSILHQTHPGNETTEQQLSEDRTENQQENTAGSQSVDQAGNQSVDGVGNQSVADAGNQSVADAGNQAGVGAGNYSVDSTGIDHQLSEGQTDPENSSCIGSSTSSPPQLPQYDESRMEIDEFCETCQTLYKDPAPHDLVLYLHALKYKGPDWEYSTPLPDWARDDWKDENSQHNMDDKPGV